MIPIWVIVVVCLIFGLLFFGAKHLNKTSTGLEDQEASSPGTQIYDVK